MLHSSTLSPTRKSKQKGLSAIEFTLALPFMLLMFAIFVEFGRMYIQYTILTKAVQGGARYYVSANPTTTDLENKIKYLVVYGTPSNTGTPILPGLTPEQVIVIPDPATSTSADYISVGVSSYSYSPLLLKFGQFDDDGLFFGLNNLETLINLPMRATSVMRDSL